jgi:hypothetical protein
MDFDPTSQFGRQRRNLMVTATILLIVQSAGVEPQRASLSGLEITIQTPKVLKAWLWIFLAYFYIRYVQAYLDLQRGLQERFNGFMQQLFMRDAEKYYSSSDDPQIRNHFTSIGPNPPHWRTWTASVVGVTYNGNEAREARTEHTVSGAGLFRMRGIAILQLTFLTSLASEFWAPFLIGLAPIFYQLYILK